MTESEHAQPTAADFKLPGTAPTNEQIVLEETRGKSSEQNPYRDSDIVAARAEAKRRDEQATVEAMPSKGYLDAKAKLEEIERERKVVEARLREEAKHTAAVIAKRQACDELQAHLKTMDDVHAGMSTPEQKAAWIREQLDTKGSACSTFEGFLNHCGRLAALEVANRFYPEWRAAFVAKIEAAEKDLVDYATEHGVQPPKAAEPGLTLSHLQIGEYFIYNGETCKVEDKDETVSKDLRVVLRLSDGRSIPLHRKTPVARPPEPIGKTVATYNL